MFLAKCVVLLAAVASISALSYPLGSQDVVFHIFSRQNPTQSQPVWPTWASILTASFLRNNRPTVITIHSSGEGVGGNFNAFVVSNHISNEDVNVVAVDWSPGSEFYSQGLGNSAQAGQVIANFVNILINQLNFDVSSFRFVGVGLGAHIAGIAARQVQGEIPHVIALDPSLIGWPHNSQKLNADDANVVEVLHTTSGILGYDLPLGDIDFYPNGGSSQLGCGGVTSCSHTFAYAFYAESITAAAQNQNQFVGTACDSFEQAVAQQCAGERGVIFGGIDHSAKQGVSGIFFFRTNPSPPFAQN